MKKYKRTSDGDKALKGRKFLNEKERVSDKEMKEQIGDEDVYKKSNELLFTLVKDKENRVTVKRDHEKKGTDWNSILVGSGLVGLGIVCSIAAFSGHKREQSETVIQRFDLPYFPTLGNLPFPQISLIDQVPMNSLSYQL